MSIVQAVHTKIIKDLKNWSNQTQTRRIQIFKQAYFMYGQSMLQALTQLEKRPEYIKIHSASPFINMQIQEKRYLLINKNSNNLSEVQCSCQTVWKRKTNHNFQLLCTHQLTYLLWKNCFSEGKAVFEDSDSSLQALVQILSIVK